VFAARFAIAGVTPVGSARTATPIHVQTTRRNASRFRDSRATDEELLSNDLALCMNVRISRQGTFATLLSTRVQRPCGCTDLDVRRFPTGR